MGSDCSREQRAVLTKAGGLYRHKDDCTHLLGRKAQMEEQRTLAAYSPWSREELDTAERLTDTWKSGGFQTQARLCPHTTAPQSCSAMAAWLLRFTPIWLASLGAHSQVAQCKRHRRCGFDPWVWKIPWRRKWHSNIPA